MGGLLLAATLCVAAQAAPIPVINTLVLEETTVFGPLPGSLAMGYQMHLDGDPLTNYNLDVDSATTNVPIDDDRFGFYLTGHPADLFTYWNAAGVNAGAAPATWQRWMWRIINGLEPMVYLDVNALGDFRLLDGLERDFNGLNLPLAVPGDYPDGTYTVVGRIRSEAGNWSAPITIELTLFHGDAESDVRDASAYLDPSGAGQLIMNPGQRVVLQRFKIEDPGTAYDAQNQDWEPDGYDTYVKTIVFDHIGAFPRADVQSLWLYRDNGDLQFNPISDTPLWIPLTGFDAGWQAVFGAPPGTQGSAFVVIPDDSIAWFFLVAVLEDCCYNLDESLQVRITNVETSYPPGTGSSRMEAVFPVDSAVGYTFATSPGQCDAELEDRLLVVVPPETVPQIQPGADDQVLQRLRLTDQGADGLPTAIRTIVFRKLDGTLDAMHLRDFRLWEDVNNDGVVDGGDDLIDYVPAGDLDAGVVFSALPNALIDLANGAVMNLLLAAQVEPAAPVGDTLRTEAIAEAADGLGDPDGGGTIPQSSRICTDMPVEGTDAVEVAGAAPATKDYETNVADMTVGRTIFGGSQDVVVQELELYDADDPAITGAGQDEDEDPDGFPTRVDTVVIDLDAGATNNDLVDNGCVTRLALVLESDGILGLTVGDTLLDEVLNPLSGDFPVEFGDPGVLLFEIPDDDEEIVYVVADFDCNACDCNDDLRTNFTATTFYDGVNHSSRFEHDPLNPSGTAPPAFPIAAGADVVLFSTNPAVDREADLTDLTMPAFIAAGDFGVVMQEFVLEDPGTRGDIVDDGAVCRVLEIAVRLDDGSTIDPEDIVNLHLYRENDATLGYSGGDALIATVVAPVLDGRSNLVGAPLFDVADVGRFYLVADFAGAGLADGDFLVSTVALHTDCAFSGIEDPQPLMANNPVTVGTGAGVPTVIIHDAALHPTGSGLVDISTTAPNMADFQVGPTETLLISNSDLVDVDGVAGAFPYIVESVNIVDPDVTGQPIEVTFTARLIAGEAPSAGVFAQLEVTGTGANGDTCDAWMTDLDVFRDPVGTDIVPYLLDPGVITLDDTAPGPGGTLAGDVNEDGTVDITDARWAAEFAIGMRPLTPAQKANADVAPPHIPPDTNIDVTDARWIAEASIGLRTLSAMAESVFGPAAYGTATVEVNAMGQLVISNSTAELADIQGTLYFDPDEVTITDVIGINGFEVLASLIDNIAGEVRFAAAKLSGSALAEGAALQFQTANDPSDALVDMDVLRDVRGRDIPYELTQEVKGAVLSFGCSPNPVDDIHTTTFSVKGTLPVDEIRVRIYNFSGAQVFDSGWGPNDLDWHLENTAGNVLANGVYYYRIEVRFVGQSETVLTEIGKVAVYR
jgi:hypothetical protein